MTNLFNCLYLVEGKVCRTLASKLTQCPPKCPYKVEMVDFLQNENNLNDYSPLCPFLRPSPDFVLCIDRGEEILTCNNCDNAETSFNFDLEDMEIVVA